MNAAELRDEIDPLPGDGWVDVCGLQDIAPDTGVCALLGGLHIAVVRVAAAGRLYAIGNIDPFSRESVLSRGIVGDRGGAPKIASPLYKQSFDLETGRCLDDAAVSVPTYPVRVVAGRVLVRAEPRPALHAVT